MAEKNRDVLVIGAGASGLVAAICAARQGCDAVVLESDIKPARKLLRTGNGRCNLSNALIEGGFLFDDARIYSNPGFANAVLEGMGCEQVKQWFAEIGLMTFEDSEGKVYPITNRARSVVDVLVNELTRLGGTIELECEVESLGRTKSGLIAARCADGRVFRAGACVVGTGDSSKIAASLGLKMKRFQPVLGPISTDTELVSKMSGVRMRCKLVVKRDGNTIFEDFGEVLFREYGISGIVVFDASRFAQPGDTIVLDILPSADIEELTAELNRRKRRLSGSRFSTAQMLDGLFAREVSDAMLDYLGVADDAAIDGLDIAGIALLAKELTLTVAQRPWQGDFQVMRGGIDVDCVDPSTCAIRDINGLFAAGEILDIDGACGGFNLHWAWVSGIKAGTNAASYAVSRRDGQ